MLTFLWLATLSSSGALIYLSIKFIQNEREGNRLKHELRRYESLTSREETEKQLDSNIQFKQNELQELDEQQEAMRTSIKNLQSNLRELEAKEYLISIDDYEPKYDFLSSEEYLQRLQKIQSDQEKMRTNKEAFFCSFTWSIGEGKKGENLGKKMTEDLLKMIESAFEEQCKYIIKEVRYSNVDKLKRKIKKTFDLINRCSQKMYFRISDDYLKLKLEELDLKYECEEKLQEEKEREKERAKELKKQKKDREDVEKANQFEITY